LIHVNNSSLLFLQVILEHLHGRIEAIINGEVVTGRSNLFVLAPVSDSIGDKVDTSLPLPKRLAKFSPSGNPVGREMSKSVPSKKIKSMKTAGTENPKVNPHPIHILANPIGYKSQLQTNLKGHIMISEKNNEAKTKKGFVTSRPSTKIQSGSISTKKKKVEEPKVHLDLFFYWTCSKCTINNPYHKNRCVCCSSRKSGDEILSPLLQIADNAIFSATTVEEALQLIPFEEHSSIPTIVLATIMRLKPPPKAKSQSSALSLKDFFKWVCIKCTAINSYTDHKCLVCERFRNLSCKSSKLLDIALKAVHASHTVKDAMLSIPTVHQMSVPESVLESLMTCCEIIGRKKNEKRRCFRTRAEGKLFCSLHYYPHKKPLTISHLASKNIPNDEEASKISNDEGMNKHNTSDVSSIGSNAETSFLKTGSSKNSEPNKLIKGMTDFFDNHLTTRSHKSWNVRSIEDAILCQENSPFPQGMLVRRFFPSYGFHDGWITLIQRKLLDEEGKGKRPVLVYRVTYKDGDAEDFMHHEINSLRQMYDVRNVLPTALPSCQVPPDTLYKCHNQSVVKIEKNLTPSGTINPKEGGVVIVNISKNDSMWTETTLSLIELQLNVVKKLTLKERHNLPHLNCLKQVEQSSNCKQYINETCENQERNPIIEWPTTAPIEPASISLDKKQNKNIPDNKKAWKINSGLWLHKEPFDGKRANTKRIKFVIPADDEDISLLNNETIVRKNLERKSDCWDPANVSKYLSWDPYRSMLCPICKIDENDHQILICDRCHRGYHMYCLRPIIVNVPTEDWHCAECSSKNSVRQPFQKMMKHLREQAILVTKFLALPFERPSSPFTIHKKELELLQQNGSALKRLSIAATSRSGSTAKVGQIYFSTNPQKNDWVLPKPLSSQGLYELSLITMVAAMKHCGMDSYSEDLVYPNERIPESMNDASLDKVQPMSKRNVLIFQQFKENLKLGLFPPIKVVFNSEIGFTVEALSEIPRHALIAEYVGEVTTMERSGETSSDSLMILLDTNDPRTSLIIDPTRTGNIARFLSGINNLSYMSKRKANVRTRRFVLNGKCRVALFTSRKIHAGDQLYYDYNAGMEGKDEVDWAKSGFYDTTNFL